MNQPRFSVIVPVYNRPNEVDELLQSLTNQSSKNFEVIVVEDGSSIPCKDVVEKYSQELNVSYFFKENSGPGTTRNYGAQKAKADYLIFFDSDCIIPSHYFDEVEREQNENPVDAFGGPDKAHDSFTDIQKAINYSMTSFFTTGGIRGGSKKLDKFYPRSFNMGISSSAFEKTGGFSKMRFGEDVDLSLRIVNLGFKTRLFQNSFVYHKRRTDFRKFYRQVYNSGIARINLHLLHPGSLKMVHTLPSLFVLGMIISMIIGFILPETFLLPVVYSLAVFFDSYLINKNLRVPTLSILAAWVQLFGYGLGFISAVWKRLILGGGEFKAFDKNFYR